MVVLERLMGRFVCGMESWQQREGAAERRARSTEDGADSREALEAEQ